MPDALGSWGALPRFTVSRSSRVLATRTAHSGRAASSVVCSRVLVHDSLSGKPRCPLRRPLRPSLEMLGAGGVIFGTVTTLPESERGNLRAEGVLSVAIVPVYSGSHWVGLHRLRRLPDRPAMDRSRAGSSEGGGEHLGRYIARKRGGADTEHFRRAGRADSSDPLCRRYPRELPHPTYVGPQLETILGITQHEWITDPNSWAIHMHPDDREFITKEYEYRSTGGTLIQEYRMIRPDNGQIVWIRDDCTLFRDESGRPASFRGDVRCHRTETPRSSCAAEAKNRTLIEQIPAVVFIRPLAGSDEGFLCEPLGRDDPELQPPNHGRARNGWMSTCITRIGLRCCGSISPHRPRRSHKDRVPRDH